MRPLFLAIAATLVPAMTFAQTISGNEWQLLAIDGKIVEIPASLQIEDDGGIGGKAPCNSWSAMNAGTLPALRLNAIRATRMACDQLADEQVFFAALALMDTVALDGPKNLILTGPEGKSMEFTLASVSSLPECKTCTPKD